MEELHKIAKAYYEAASEDVKKRADDVFKTMDHDGDGCVSLHEFLAFMREAGYPQMKNSTFFRGLSKNGTESLDFFEVVTLYYIIQSGRPFCEGCSEFINGVFFTCVKCFDCDGTTFNLCFHCFQSGTGKYKHEHNQFLDNFVLLEAKRKAALKNEASLSDTKQDKSSSSDTKHDKSSSSDTKHDKASSSDTKHDKSSSSDTKQDKASFSDTTTQAFYEATEKGFSDTTTQAFKEFIETKGTGTAPTTSTFTSIAAPTTSTSTSLVIARTITAPTTSTSTSIAAPTTSTSKPLAIVPFNNKPKTDELRATLLALETAIHIATVASTFCAIL